MSLKALFEKEGQQIVNDLRSSLDANKVNASGRLRASITSEATDDRLIISAFSYITTSEEGRRPTSKGGTGILRKRIERWLEDKNIPEWENTSRESQAFVIARKIHQSGTKLWQEQRRSGVLSSVLTEQLLTDIIEKAAKQKADEIFDGLVQTVRDEMTRLSI